MRTSELIHELTDLMKKHGDLEILVVDACSHANAWEPTTGFEEIDDKEMCEELDIPDKYIFVE